MEILAARAAGPGPNAWWDNTSCRNPDYHLPDLGSAQGLTIPQLNNRAVLLRQLDQLRGSVDSAFEREAPLTWDAHQIGRSHV